MRKGLEPEFGAMRHVIAGGNLQPTVAHYLRPPGEPGYRPLVIEVLRIDGALVAEITSFVFPELFPAFGLPSVL